MRNDCKNLRPKRDTPDSDNIVFAADNIDQNSANIRMLRQQLPAT